MPSRQLTTTCFMAVCMLQELPEDSDSLAPWFGVLAAYGSIAAIVNALRIHRDALASAAAAELLSSKPLRQAVMIMHAGSGCLNLFTLCQPARRAPRQPAARRRSDIHGETAAHSRVPGYTDSAWSHGVHTDSPDCGRWEHRGREHHDDRRAAAARRRRASNRRSASCTQRTVTACCCRLRSADAARHHAASQLEAVLARAA